MIFRSLKKTRKSVCASFTTVCNSSLTYTTYKPSHDNHSIIPFSNHHTIIILKSIELRNIFISLRTRVFPLLNKRKTAIFHMQRKKKCQQQHGEHLCCKGEPCRRQNAFTRAVVVVVRRPTKASFRLLSRRTQTRQKPCRFSFSYLQVCFVLYLI